MRCVWGYSIGQEGSVVISNISLYPIAINPEFTIAVIPDDLACYKHVKKLSNIASCNNKYIMMAIKKQNKLVWSSAMGLGCYTRYNLCPVYTRQSRIKKQSNRTQDKAGGYFRGPDCSLGDTSDVIKLWTKLQSLKRGDRKNTGRVDELTSLPP